MLGPQAGYAIKSQQKEISRIVTALGHLPQKNPRTAQSNLQHLAKHIDSLGPQRTLERGFAIISRNNVILKDGQSLDKGDTVMIRFAKEKAEAQVTDIDKNNRNS
ncbi:exodeoxyribonuclease VII large subunit [Mucilaginibacter sp. R-33]|uniref:exodeoxyribonuclease VII large subunit n=1 Tax=Mucilaginibacter sp. R-33 TaxID=3416711 RepID=UPI003CE88340